MELKKRLKTLIILMLIVGGIFIYLWFTWGIGIEHTGGFTRGTEDIFEDIEMFQGNEDSYIVIEGKENVFGIPLIVMFMALDSPPYHIKLQLKDETQTLRKMIIETIEVVYDDGDKTQERVDLIKDFTAETVLRGGYGGKNKKIPVMWLECKLDSVVGKSKSCTVKLKGCFVNAAEEKISFDTSTYFEYELPYWRVYTLSGINIIG